MRVERVRDRCQVQFQQTFTIHSAPATQVPCVAAAQLIDGLFRFRCWLCFFFVLVLFGFLQIQQCEFDLAAPAIACFVGVRCVLRDFWLDRNLFVDCEIEFTVQQLLCNGNTLLDPSDEAVEYLIGQPDIARLDVVVDAVAVLLEFVKVTLVKVQLHRVQSVQKQLQCPCADFVVQLLA